MTTQEVIAKPTRLPNMMIDWARASSLRGKPPCDRRCRAGERPGFATAEQETDRDQRTEVPSRPGQGGEPGPPDHDAGQHKPGAEAVGEPSTGDLEQDVAENKARPRQTDLLQG